MIRLVDESGGQIFIAISIIVIIRELIGGIDKLHIDKGAKTSIKTTLGQEIFVKNTWAEIITRLTNIEPESETVITEVE